MKIQIGDEIRDMTQDEIDNFNRVVAEREKEQLDAATAQVAAAKAKQSAISKLKALGLTDDEIVALVG